jgi:hypothetical protein
MIQEREAVSGEAPPPRVTAVPRRPGTARETAVVAAILLAFFAAAAWLIVWVV